MRQREVRKTNRAGLRQNIQDYLSEVELRQMVFDLDLKYDELSGTEKSDKIISLINQMENNGRMYQLVNMLQDIRPNVLWTYDEGETRPENGQNG